MEHDPLNHLPDSLTCSVAVIGLGYVGLPLAVEFAKNQPSCLSGAQLHRNVIGFDINNKRVSELQSGIDRTNEITSHELQAASLLQLTTDTNCLATADVFVVTVPTPIDNAKRPDLTPLQKASVTVGRALKARALNGSSTSPIVIYESTVYPGATEEVCVPILEAESGLKFNSQFFCGYSPERINPGDSEHKLTTITKVTSGSSPEAALWIDEFYASIIAAGTHLASCIKVAESAKVIENTQRDLNIALVNELALIFSHMDIDTLDVLEAAGTKWNFLNFRPGLVGGHCIGVDPYYLTHKAEQLGYHPQVVLAGRRINDGMGRWLAEHLVLALAQRRKPVVGIRVLVLGLTFKENCPDLRNTKVVDLINSLCKFGMEVDVVDPWVDPTEAMHEYGLEVKPSVPERPAYGAVVVAVAHDQFLQFTSDQWSKLVTDNGVTLDLKGIVPRELAPVRI